MKKYFMLMAAVATVFAISCKKSPEEPQVDNPGTEVVEEDDTPQAVVFGTNVATVKSPITKGLGAIDDWSNITGGDAKKLYVYGLEKLNAGHDLNNIFIDNVGAAAPAAGSGLDRRDDIAVYDYAHALINNPVNPEDYSLFYYGDNKKYDFYGYYVDDAATYDGDGFNNKPVTTVTPASSTITLGVEIDGTQDIMLANTNKAEDIAWRTDQSRIVTEDQLYSAVSARRGVVPNLNFEHKLSRFVFNVVAANADVIDTKHTNVEGLKLYSYPTGTLTIYGENQGLAPITDVQQTTEGVDPQPLYYQVDANSAKTWITGTTVTNYPVFDKGLVGKVNNPGWVFAVKPANEGDPVPATAKFSDIMVFPGQNSYHFQLALSQTNTPYTAVNPYLVDLDVKIGPDAQADLALAGKKYIVNVIVYGLEEVKISVSLAEWDEVSLGWIDPDGSNDVTSEEVTLALEKQNFDSSANAANVDINGYNAEEPQKIAITAATYGGGTALAGEDLTNLKATAYFKSSDNAKVKVNKSTGALTPVAPGAATITVTVAWTKVGEPDVYFYGSQTIAVTVVDTTP